PEQAQDASRVDARADLYSLGCTAFFLLTGGPPFPGGTLLEKLDRHRFEEPPQLVSRRPDVPPGLAAVVHKLLAKRPADRYQTAADVVASLDGAGVQAGPLPQAETLPEGSNPWGGLTETKPPTRLPRRWRPWALAGIGVLGLVAALVLLLTKRSPPHAAEPEGPPVVEVVPDRPWQDTGVDVAEGEPVTLTPKGVWRKGELAASAKGLPEQPRDWTPWPEAPLLCLLARVGDGDPVPVPGTQQMVPKQSGRLYLQANDLGLGKYSGRI